MKEKKHYEIYYRNGRRINWGWRLHRWWDPYLGRYNRRYYRKLGVTHSSRVLTTRWVETSWGPTIYCVDNNWTYLPRWSRYAHPRTQAERRENAFFDKSEEKREYKIKFRRARSYKELPTNRDDHYNRPHRSWKKTHKVRKQWMKNL